MIAAATVLFMILVWLHVHSIMIGEWRYWAGVETKEARVIVLSERIMQMFEEKGSYEGLESEMETEADSLGLADAFAEVRRVGGGEVLESGGGRKVCVSRFMFLKGEMVLLRVCA